MSFSQLLLLLGAARTTMAGPMAAWWTTVGPQFMMQNETSGGLQYSMCNSNSTPVFPNDPPFLLSLSNKPRTGTAVAGTGWWDNTETIASIFYHDVDNNLINTYLKCDSSTGRFSTTGSYVISNGVPKVNNEANINANTGLAAILLGETGGYRVYYHDLNTELSQIGYSTENDLGWVYEGVVSRDPSSLGTGIGAQFTGDNNISVVTPRDAANIEVSRYNSDELWHISTLPGSLASDNVTNTTEATNITLSTGTTAFSLPAWNGNVTSLGISIDHSFVRSIFYIGTDSTLHQVANINSVWELKSNQSTTVWPLADEANADFAIASDYATSVIRLYYFVNGTLTEISNGLDATWIDAVALPSFNASSPTSSTDPSSTASGTSTSTATGGSTSGLASGAKAGIGVGVSLGAIALLGIAGMSMFVVRRRRKDSAEASKAEQRDASVPLNDYASSSGYGNSPGTNPATPYGTYPQEMDPSQKPVEVANSQAPLELGAPSGISEMEQQNYSHELMGEGHWRELPDNQVHR